MLKKFENVRDEELVFLYKKSKDDDVEMELVLRYQIHSKKLASEQYHKFRYVFLVEYEDIYSLCMFSLFSSIKAFKRNGSFFRFWKTLTINKINVYVSGLPLLKFEGNGKIISTSRDNSPVLTLMSPSHTEDNIDLSSDIERILMQNKDNFDKKDRDIFILYVAGYSLTDIANETGLNYHYVCRRMKEIRRLIEKYFVQS